jgi:opacity protein-like surface antigen
MRKLALLAAASFAAMATPALAQETVVYNGTTYNIGDTITIDYLAVNTPGASGTLQLQFTGTSGLDYNFIWTLTNTSDSSQGTGANIGSFGFNVTGGTIDAGTSTVSTDDPNGPGINLAVSGQNISGGNNKLDICFTGGATCSGTSNEGPRVGEEVTGDLGMEFTSALPDSITLTNPIIRFQNTVPTGSDIGTPGGTPPMPEPGTWALMLLGFGATGVAIRRSRRKGLLTQIA